MKLELEFGKPSHRQRRRHGLATYIEEEEQKEEREKKEKSVDREYVYRPTANTMPSSRVCPNPISILSSMPMLHSHSVKQPKEQVWSGR